MGIDDSGKYQNRYEFSSKIICKECGSTFRRQKIYIGKPYEKIKWCCIQHIKDIKKCSMKAVREDIIKEAFLTMWNKFVSKHTEILDSLLESLKNLRIDHEQEEEIKKLNNRIMELTEQSHILSRVVSKSPHTKGKVGLIVIIIILSRHVEMVTLLTRNEVLCK